jgi:hypothetical protein
VSLNVDEIAAAEAALPAARRAVAESRQALVAALRAVPGNHNLTASTWDGALIGMAVMREHLSGSSTEIANARRALQAAILAEKEIVASINRAKQAQVSAV